MSSNEASHKGICRYKLALARGMSNVDAYIKGLDFLIDDVFKGRDFVSDPEVAKAIAKYEKAVA